MTYFKRPEEAVFASGAKPGEMELFPDIARGWGVSFDKTAGIPPMEWFNALFQRSDEAIHYLLQRGIAEWSASTDYPAGAYVQFQNKVWQAQRGNKNKAPSTNTVEWSEAALTRDEILALLQTSPLFLRKEDNLSDLIDHAAALKNLGAAPEQHRHLWQQLDDKPALFPAAPHQHAAADISGLSTVPAGAVIAFTVAEVPEGWLKANGAALSRSLYADLFSVIGTTFGEGDGETTFNLPDLRGEFIRGWDDGRNIDMGRILGSWQEHQFQNHTHYSTSSGWKIHGGNDVSGAGVAYGQSGKNTAVSGDYGAENRPRNIALLYCIKY